MIATSTTSGLLSLLLLLKPATALPRRLDTLADQVERRAPPQQASAGQPLLPRDVQGSGYLSDYDGQVVQVQGVVTAKSSAGFYIQTEPAKVDKIDSTSEGLYVRPLSRRSRLAPRLTDLLPSPGLWVRLGRPRPNG